MSLSGALGNSLSGLRATQSAMEVISSNVSNAGTAGYSRRSVVAVETDNGSGSGGVRIEGIIRLFDSILQKELRTETSGSGYTGVKSSMTTELSRLFGAPGSSTALDTMMSKFTSSLQALQTDPSNAVARSSVLNAAGDLAHSINKASDGVQALRQDADCDRDRRGPGQLAPEGDQRRRHARAVDPGDGSGGAGPARREDHRALQPHRRQGHRRPERLGLARHQPEG